MARPKKRHHDGHIPAWAGQMKKEIYRELVTECYPVALADLCVLGVTVLADKFGWSKELITVWCNELILNLQAIQDGELDLYELQDSIAEDYDIRIGWDQETKTLTFETPNKERA